MSTPATEEVTPGIEEVTDPGDAAIIEQVVTPQADPRAARMAELTREIDRQADAMRAAQTEITRLSGRRRPSLNNHHNLAGVDDGDGYNAGIDKLIKDQWAISDAAEKEMFRIQGLQAALRAEVQRDTVTKSDPWLGNESKSRSTIDKLERSIRVGHRRITAEIDTTEQRRVKALEEVKKTELTLGDFQRMRQREYANPDPLKPNALRNRDLDIKTISDRLTQQRADVSALDDRLSELRTQLGRVNRKLDDVELCRVKIHARALLEEYCKLAAPMGRVLSELREIYQSDQRTSSHQEALDSLVNWPFGNSALKSIAALPKPFFPPAMPVGGASSWEHAENYFYSANTLVTAKGGD